MMTPSVEIHRGYHGREEGSSPNAHVDLHWYQGYTQAQFGTMLGISEHGVRKRWIEARLKLIETLGPIEDWPGNQ